MRKPVLILPAALLLFGFAGCCPGRIITGSEVRDSVSVVRDTQYFETIRDTVIHVPLPAESRETEGLRDSSFLQTALAFSEAVVGSDGRLRHTLENKPGPLAVMVPLREKRTVEVEISQKKSRTVIELPVKEPLSGREKFFIYSGVALWSMVAGVLMVFVVRFFRR